MYKKRYLWWGALLFLSIALLALGCPYTPAAQVDITAPEPVTINAANIRTPSSITLQWEPSSSNDVAEIRITWESTNGTKSETPIIIDPTQTMFTIAGLEPNITYTFYITTVDAANNISDIVEITAATLPVVYPIAFAEESYFFTNIEVDPSSIIGTLPEPAIAIDPDDTNPPAITVTYAIIANTDDDSALFAIDSATAQIIIGDTPLDATREYTFTVEATSSQGATATTAVFVVPPDTTAPDPVTFVRAIADPTSADVTLAWDDSVSTDAAFVIITWVDASGTASGPVRIAHGIGTARITGLVSETFYTFSLVVEDGAVNAQGVLTPNVSAAVPATVTTSDITAPAAVTMLAAIPAGNEVMLTWVDSVSDDVSQIEITWEITGSGTSLGTQPASPGDQTATISGLTSETDYTFRLTVRDTAGISSPAVPIDATTLDITAPPAVPSATATPDANGSTVVLTWADPAATDLAHIAVTWRRSDDTGNAGGPIQVNAGVRTATITGLTDETAYIFTLVAVDSAGNRARDFDVTGTTADITAPNAATGLTANAVAATVNVDLVWTPSSDTSTDVATVTIEWTTAVPGVDGGSANIDPITTTATTITGLTAATLYTFVVHTADAAGNSSASTTASVTTNTPPDLTPPAAVTITTAVAVTDSSNVDLTWSTPAPDVDTTTVRWALASDADANIGSMIINPSTTTTATITTLNAATAYVFTVRVADAAGNINDSPSRTVTTNTPPDTTAPNSVDMVTATPAANSITLSWRASSSADAAIVDITWAPNHGDGTTGVRIAHTAGRQSTIITGLNSDITYSFTLITEDAAGNRSVPLFHTDTTLDNIKPNPISSFSAQPLAGGSSIELTWTDSGSDDAASVHITWTPVGVAGAAGIRIAQGTQSATITGLISDTEYIFSAVVEDEVPNSSATRTVRVDTLDITNPDPISNLRATTTQGSTDVTLSWDNSPSDDATIIRITWMVTGTGTVEDTEEIMHGSANSIVITGLTSEEDYTFTLIVLDDAVDVSGNPAPRASSAVDAGITTPDAIPPSPVSSFTAVPLPSTTEVELSWLNSGSADAATLEIAWTSTGTGIAPGSSTIASGTGMSTHTISGLTPNTPYAITITVIDDAANRSRAITATPDPVTTLIIIDADDDGLIDISSLDRLNNIRHNLAGTSYKTINNNSGVMCGAAFDTACSGYELTQSLDFAHHSSYDSNSINAAWRPNAADPDDATNNGWEPIGDDTDPFASTFEGNGYTISNLYVRRAGRVGLFGQTNSSATIRAVGIIDNAIYGSSGDDDYVGGLVGYHIGSITASYATGSADGGNGDNDYVGGLVGYSTGGFITASYASGDVNGGDGSDTVGGLVGYSDGSRIIASYATGTADGSDGTDSVGGLVGQANTFNIITASYATGDVDGGDDDDDLVGGLVGYNDSSNIIASYATGDADGGDGDNDLVGALVGFDDFGTIIASYGFGTLTNVDTAGVDDSDDRPSGVFGVGSGPNGARLLTSGNTPAAWNSASSRSMNAWNFGTTTDIPTLRYADYDGSITAYGCSTTTGNASTIPATVPDGSGGTITVICGTTPLPGQTPAVDPDLIAEPVDSDNDGLIDISSLDQLNNIRHNLAGTSYKTSSGDRGIMCGAGLSTACSGYELMQSLDFASASSYDNNSINAAWRPTGGDSDTATNAGWEPIGDATNSFATVFEGNGYSIGNLYVRRAGRAGLFGQTNGSATIRNIGIIDNAIYGSSGDDDYVGGLVGRNFAIITASYATGTADGGDGDNDYVGGLVGANGGGGIITSYASGDVDGGNGNDTVGGLVGESSSTIIASYATGTADGGDGNDSVGGLVGYANGSSIASYATGDVDGGDGNDSVGGLIGDGGGSVIASYATGDVDGGDGDTDYVGGLVGWNSFGGSVIASYATGDVDGGTGTSDRVGALVGQDDLGTITASYGFGILTNVDTAGVDDSGDRPNGVLGVGSGRNGARLLTSGNTPAEWDSAADDSMNAWIFGTTTDIPTLRYADYDGSSRVYGCGTTTGTSATIPTTVPNGSGGTITVVCGTTPLPGQTPAVDPALIVNPFDSDSDGLIDISSLNQLNNIRHNLAGTSYKTSSGDSGFMCGAGLNTACSGYELMQSLDFASASSYDSNSINAAWHPTGGDPDTATNAGWEPIGNAANSFTPIFEGNGYTISNLYVRRTSRAGLFGQTSASATIRAVGIIDNAVYGSSADDDYVGGLVGWSDGGNIVASYASGDVDGGDGNDTVGGLMGYANGSTIIASYATGGTDGGDGHDNVGGLVGRINNFGTITASYATGDVNGGDGDDLVGGLVGVNEISDIIASYATGNVNGGDGNTDAVGALVGFDDFGTITASYGFGTLTNVDDPGIDDSGDRPAAMSVASGTGTTGAARLLAPDPSDSTNTAVAAIWNQANNNTQNAWDFGTTADIPALRYADYDGSSTRYSCADIPTTVPDGSGGTITVTCDTTLLPGQR